MKYNKHIDIENITRDRKKEKGEEGRENKRLRDQDFAAATSSSQELYSFGGGGSKDMLEKLKLSLLQIYEQLYTIGTPLERS